MADDVASLQIKYVQLLQQIVGKLGDIVKTLEKEWKEASEEYAYEVQILKNLEKTNKRIATLKAEVAAAVNSVPATPPAQLQALKDSFVNDSQPLRDAVDNAVNNLNKI